MLEDAEAGRDARPALASPAGRQGRGDRRQPCAVARRRAPDLSNAQEEQARAIFQTDHGVFMLNWPYVLAAARAAAEEGTLDTGRRRRHRLGALPAGVPGPDPARRRSAAPTWAVGAYSKHPEQAATLVECVNALPKATQYMLDEGEPSPYAASYDDPRVRGDLQNADLIRESIADGGPRPLTPFYVDVAGSIIQTWHPPASVNAETPDEDRPIHGRRVGGRRLL